MKKEIVRELCEELNEKEKKIEIMFELARQIGYNTNDTIKLIDEFYQTCPKLVHQQWKL